MLRGVVDQIFCQPCSCVVLDRPNMKLFLALLLTLAAAGSSFLPTAARPLRRGIALRAEQEDEPKENIFTLLNPFKQAPSATKREKEEYKREAGSTPRTTSDSKYHLAERKKFGFGSDEKFEINAYKKLKGEEESEEA